MPGYNSTFAGISGGTIVQGHLPASPGADYFTVTSLGVDVSPAYINASNGGIATDAFFIVNKNGQVLGARQVESPRIENVSCLGHSPTAAVHCMLAENVNHAYVHNVVTAMNCHGLVLKGTNSTVDGVYARGHGIDAVIVESDDYAPTSKDDLSTITIEPLIAAGDTKGIIKRFTAALSHISVSHAAIRSPLAWGVYVQGASSTTPATALNFSDITLDYEGGSPAFHYCMQFVQYVGAVNINNLNCSNVWADIAPYAPASGAFDDFSVTNSQFTNIATNGSKPMGDGISPNDGISPTQLRIDFRERQHGPLWSDNGLGGYIHQYRRGQYVLGRRNLAPCGSNLNLRRP